MDVPMRGTPGAAPNIATTVARPQQTTTENGPYVEQMASERRALRVDFGMDFRYPRMSRWVVMAGTLECA